MTGLKSEIHLVVHQTAPLLGEVEANEVDLRKRVEASRGADLLVFPELALTGYSLRNRVQAVATSLGDGPPLVLPVDSPPLALGLPERGRDELVYNTAVLQHQGRILARHRKVYLPTYGIFDEARYFAPGRQAPPAAELPSGWRVGLLVCEDFWHPGLLYLLAMRGVDAILVLSAAPGRGEPPGVEEGGEPGALFSSTESWKLLARTAAVQYGIYLILVNRAGVEEGLSFAGGSLAVAPGGEILQEAPQGKPATLELTLTRKTLRRSRTPFAHLRDDDPHLVARGLEDVLRDPERAP